MNHIIQCLALACLSACFVASLADAGTLSADELQLLSSRKAVQTGTNFFAAKIAENEKQEENQLTIRDAFKRKRKVFEDKIAALGDDEVVPVPAEEQVRHLVRQGEEDDDNELSGVSQLFAEHDSLLRSYTEEAPEAAGEQ